MSMRTVLRSLAAALLVAVVAPACTDGDGSVDTGDEQDVSATTGHFETFKGEDGQYYFQLLAANGEPLLRSEGYKTLSSAKNGITSTKKNGVTKARFKVLQADSGEYYFNLVAGNGQVLAMSETYVSKSNADRAVDTVIKTVTDAPGLAAATGDGVFETFFGADGKAYFRLRAANGQIVLQSQGYTSKASATAGITSVKKNGIDASKYVIAEGVDGQHYFRIKAGNGQIIGRSEMYASKSGAMLGAARVRDLLLDLSDASEPSDADIQTEIEKASDGLLFTSESDFPFTYVSAPLADGKVSEAAVRAAFAAEVDGDEAADKPMSSLVSMSATWETWKSQEHNCSDTSDPVGAESCQKMRTLEQVIESNLTDVEVYYFGAKGTPGDVQGIGVSVFIVGKSPSGKMVGVRTIAIWT